ncbi:hypothetical protein MKX01_009677 [Papaver californicum]|nr:hypothetical protein MKX01_009677 [Papaver californicum]
MTTTVPSHFSKVSFLSNSFTHGFVNFSSSCLLNSNLKFKEQRSSRICKASLITNPEDFEVGRSVGSYGFMNITSYSKSKAGSEDASTAADRLRAQDVAEGQVKIRLYEGRITQGPSKGTRVIFKSDPKDISKNIQILLGGFETQTGEQWLAFCNDGNYSAADYAKVGSDIISKDNLLGEQNSWNPFEQEQKIKRRRNFVLRLLQGVMKGLAYMHDHERLHQSLGPASVVLNTIVEKDAAYLVLRLRDSAFSVDLRNSTLEESSGALSEGLWRRASSASAFSSTEKRAFGIADDIYGAGHLFAYLAFIPFCPLQRLLENTFQLDLKAAREYCLADDRLLEAVKFLDLDGGSGWQLLQATLNPDFRKRPVAEAVFSHQFMNAAIL